MSLRWILGRAVRSAAKAKAAGAVRSTVATAVSGAFREEAEPVEPPDDDHCHVAILFDLPMEVESFVSRLSGVVTTRAAGFEIHVGGLSGKRVAAAVCGPNRDGPELLVKTIVAGHRPNLVVAAGQACGLVDSVQRGDAIIASQVADEHGAVLEISLHADPADRVHIGRLVSLVATPERTSDKRSLAEQTYAVAADRSSFRIGDGCRRAAVPFMAVRVVSETVADDLPRDVSHLLAQQSLVGKTEDITGALWRRPGSLKDMWQL